MLCATFLAALLLVGGAAGLNIAPFRPHYHYTSPSGWTGPPKSFAQFKNEFHVWFERNTDFSQVSADNWGHAHSADIFQWQTSDAAVDMKTPDGGSVVTDTTKQVVLDAKFVAAVATGSGFSLKYSADGLRFADVQNYNLYKEKGLKDPLLFLYKPDQFLSGYVIQKNASVAELKVAECVKPNFVKQERSLFVLSGSSIDASGKNLLGDVLDFDIFPLVANGRRVEKTVVLMVNINNNPGFPNSICGTAYWIANLDKIGGEYVLTQRDNVEFMDSGRDASGFKSFAHGNGYKVMGGFGNIFDSRKGLPYTGGFTFPRLVTGELVNKKYVLKQEPDEDVLKNLRCKFCKGNTAITKCVCDESRVTKDVLLMEFNFTFTLNHKKFGKGKVDVFTLSSSRGDSISFTYDWQKTETVFELHRVSRTPVSDTPYNNYKVLQATRSTAIQTPDVNVHMLVDANSVEMFIDQGMQVMTALVFPEQPYDKMVWGADVDTKTYQMTRLKSVLLDDTDPSSRVEPDAGYGLRIDAGVVALLTVFWLLG